MRGARLSQSGGYETNPDGCRLHQSLQSTSGELYDEPRSLAKTAIIVSAVLHSESSRACEARSLYHEDAPISASKRPPSKPPRKDTSLPPTTSFESSRLQVGGERILVAVATRAV